MTCLQHSKLETESDILNEVRAYNRSEYTLYGTAAEEPRVALRVN